ncbi:MAG: exopolyphosphatase [Aestuariibacter sp.]
MTELEDALSGVTSRDVTNVAALDIGSNSFHLVVARIVADSVQILHRVKQKVRLADGLGEDGILSDEAIQRGLDALQVCKESLQGFQPDTVRIVATYTLRKAINGGAFISAARKILPYPIEVISGVEEARLIYQGVAHTTVATGNRLVIDIGGGSTEFIIGEDFDPKLMRSVTMGCVSYTQKYFADGELRPKAFSKAIVAAQQELELIADKYCAMGWEQCIGTSGTIKTLASLQAELLGNEGEMVITLAGLKALIDQCCDAGRISKLKFSELSEDRRPVFPAGLAVLTAIFESLDIEEMQYSPAALREGVLYEMEDRLEHHDIRQRTAESIAVRYDVDTQQAKRVLNTTSFLYEQCAGKWQLKNAELKSILGWAALLHEVGLQINSRGVQRHSAYILANAELPGFNQEQQTVLATLVANHRKKIRGEDIPEFAQFDRNEVLKLIALLRLGVLLNMRRQDNILPKIKVTAEQQAINLHFTKNWLNTKPLVVADLDTEYNRLQAIDIHFSFT